MGEINFIFVKQSTMKKNILITEFKYNISQKSGKKYFRFNDKYNLFDESIISQVKDNCDKVLLFDIEESPNPQNPSKPYQNIRTLGEQEDSNFDYEGSTEIKPNVQRAPPQRDIIQMDKPLLSKHLLP